MGDDLVSELLAHVHALCGVGIDRHPGTERNRAATRYVSSALRDIGAVVEEIAFDVPDWSFGESWVEAGAGRFAMHAGPFSPAQDAAGPLVVVTRPEELDGLDARGSVLLLCGAIAAAQLTPRDYPWYGDARSARILDALEASAPLAVIAATGKNPDTTGAMSPFPLIEEPRFTCASGYLSEESGARFAAGCGETVRVHIDSEVCGATGVQVVGRMRGTGSGRIIVGAHVDTKYETPGALDNAAGVATLLGVARLLAGQTLAATVEFVPFNGEDHALSPGEVAYLAAYPDLTDVRLMANVDDAGLAGAPTACSAYGLPDALANAVADAIEASVTVEQGPQWPASDHMIFAMRGVPAIALISADAASVMGEITHTPADTPERVDGELLADAARFVADVVKRVR